MKRYFLFFTTCIIVQNALGQTEDKEYSPVNNFFFSEILETLDQYPANYLYTPVKDHTASVLSYKHEAGGYKPGAIPETLQRIGLETSGIFRNEKGILFFGDLSVEKSFYDDLKWNLSYQVPEQGLMEDPHYFGVSEGAKWDNQNFDLSGGMLLPVMGNLHFLAKADYNLFNKYRTNLDPRPKIIYDEMKLQGGFNFELTEQHHFKISAEYGYAHVENEVKFSNNEKNLPANYDTYVKWIAGYGSLVSPFKNTTRRKHEQRGLNLGYTFSSHKTLFFADLSFLQKEQITYRSGAVEDEKDPSEYFAVYYPETLNITLSAIRFLKEEHLLRTKITLEAYKAHNFLTSKGGKNYAANRKQLEAEVAYINQLNNGFTNLDTGFSLRLWQVEQQDALAMTRSDLTNLEIGFYGLKSWKSGEKFIFTPFAHFKFTSPIHSEFTNGNENYLENIGQNDFSGLALRTYYNEVIYPDFEYFTTENMELSAGTSFNFISAQKFSSLFTIRGGMRKALRPISFFQNEDSMRFYSSASLTVYY